MALKTRLLTDLQEAIPAAKRNGPALDDPHLCAAHFERQPVACAEPRQCCIALEGDGMLMSVQVRRARRINRR